MFWNKKVGLEKITPIGSTINVVTDGKITVRGQEILMNNHLRWNETSYILDMKYKSLTAMFAVADGEGRGDRTVTFTNIDTGEVIGTFTNKVNERPIPIEIDLVGVDKLRITSGGSASTALYNIELDHIAAE